MEVRFREFNPFNCWIWMRFPHPVGAGERGYLETAFDSWFFLGKLGGFALLRLVHTNLKINDKSSSHLINNSILKESMRD